jgi:hypothetical protein
VLLSFSVIIFRSVNIHQTAQYFYYLFANITTDADIVFYWLKSEQFIAILLMILIEWVQRKKQYALQIETLPVFPRYFIYAGALLVFIYLGQFNSGVQFVYFQF